MPILPPDRSLPTATDGSHCSQWAQSFGSDAQRYDRTRPTYPPALVERVLLESPGRDILDVGIGTGISARPFVAAGCRVLGVEPDERMAAVAVEHGFDVEVATFEEWEPAGRVFDVVLAGQSWHWVDSVTGAARAGRVLRPGGRLAVFWNAFQLPPALANSVGAVYQRVLPDAPFTPAMSVGAAAYSGQLLRALEGMRQVDAFGEPEQWEFTWERPQTRDEWLEQIPTFGGHNQIPADTLDELLAGIGAAVDDVGGSFTMRYTTVAATARTDVSNPAAVNDQT